MISPKRFFIILTCLLLTSLTLSAQRTEQKDSLVRLMSAQSGHLKQKNGIDYREIIGPARFLHNDTYLICDTALWNVNMNVINCWGHVKIIQEQTVLSGEKLDYFADDNLAKMYGGTVQLEDKDRNILRTKQLDYNTRDSIAVFENGGSMRTKDGQIIESHKGTYDSKARLFTFTTDVNMYSDTTFIKTSVLRYDTEKNFATFGLGTHAWNKQYMLSSNDGWFNRLTDTFFFCDKAHLMSDTQEGWSDSLYYHRPTKDLEMYGNIQMDDTTRNVTFLAGKLTYRDSTSVMEMFRNPAIRIIQKTEAKADTVWYGGDTLRYQTVKMCDIPKEAIDLSASRLSDLETDAVGEYRKKANEANEKKRKEAIEAKMRDEGRPVDKKSPTPGPVTPAADTIPAPIDTLPVPKDTLTALKDTIAVQPDTTKMGFLWGKSNVRVYRKDMQALCGLMEYNDLDSLVRMYNDPIVWNSPNRQYTADSISVVIKNGSLNKAVLMSDAFISVQEDSLHFDQIKGAEMVAYFDTTGTLARFDALGTANGLFYLKEKEALATVDKFESKMMSATLKNGEIDGIVYFEAIKNDAYPVVQLPKPERELKGFRWDIEKKPEDRYAISTQELKPSNRLTYERITQPVFQETEIYFPGYMKEIREGLAHPKIKRAPKDTAIKHTVDTVKAVVDTVVAIPVSKDTTVRVDTTAITAAVDTVATAVKDTVVTPDPKALKKAAKEQKRKERLAAREARWAELDRRDAEKAAAKEEKKKAKARKRTLKMLKKLDQAKNEDDRMFQKYKARYEKIKASQNPVEEKPEVTPDTEK